MLHLYILYNHLNSSNNRLLIQNFTVCRQNKCGTLWKWDNKIYALVCQWSGWTRNHMYLCGVVSLERNPKKIRCRQARLCSLCQQIQKFYPCWTKKGHKVFYWGNWKRCRGNFLQRGIKWQLSCYNRLNEANQEEDEFLAEVSIIGRINHMNLIKVWGYCAKGKHRLLVFEYMEYGFLADNLSVSATALDWEKRFKIAVGTTKGLATTWGLLGLDFSLRCKASKHTSRLKLSTRGGRFWPVKATKQRCP